MSDIVELEVFWVPSARLLPSGSGWAGGPGWYWREVPGRGRALLPGAVRGPFASEAEARADAAKLSYPSFDAVANALRGARVTGRMVDGRFQVESIEPAARWDCDDGWRPRGWTGWREGWWRRVGAPVK